MQHEDPRGAKTSILHWLLDIEADDANDPLDGVVWMEALKHFDLAESHRNERLADALLELEGADVLSWVRKNLDDAKVDHLLS